MSDLNTMTATQLRGLLTAGKCSALEIMTDCLAQIERIEPSVKAFVDLDAKGALEQARQSDQRKADGPLQGIPIAVKDTVDVKGLRCVWGSPIHKDRVPVEDSTVVAKLRAAGAIIVGTTVTTEYAIAKAGPTTNPHNSARTPGGSSSGSGAVVAAQMVPLSVATQSVGSIIRPSSYCGVFGLKGTIGAISTKGAMALSTRLDHVGPMARSVSDIALACMAMFDKALPPLTQLDRSTKVLRIDGPLAARIEPPTAEALDRATDVFTQKGIEVIPVELPPRFSQIVDCYEAIIFSDLTRKYETEWRDNFSLVSPRLREIMNAGLGVTPAAYEAAITDATYFRNYLLSIMPERAIILTPATDGYAPTMSDRTGEQKLQSLWTVVGFPSLAVPCGKLDGLPISVQIAGRPNEDQLCLAGGLVIEERYGEESLLSPAVTFA